MLNLGLLIRAELVEGCCGRISDFRCRDSDVLVDKKPISDVS